MKDATIMGKKAASQMVFEPLENSSADPNEKVILDYITGEKIRATPEEVSAVQVFIKRLVEDFHYDKGQIQAHPQFRAKTAPSGEEKYPIDITVFKSERKTYDNVYMVIECKKPNRRDGFKQLLVYLNLVPSVEFGIWFNGNEHLYLRRVIKNGILNWEEIPDIPKKGERIEDVGYYLRKNLEKPKNLKTIFNDIRNHLAGTAKGITRDETIAQEIINILFCKLYDELNKIPDEMVEFRVGVEENKVDVKLRIDSLFDKVKSSYEDIFDKEDKIRLDEDSLVYVVGELQKYAIIEADRDAIGDAFEVFIGPALRGEEGQFFTPRNVVKMVVEMIDPEPGNYIIDPACGSGGFLIYALEHQWNKIEQEGKDKNWPGELITRKKKDIASKYFFGIEKDSFLAKVTKAYMAIIGDGRGGIFCENSLADPSEWQYNPKRIATNPSLPLSVRRSISFNEHVRELHTPPGI